MFRFPRLIQLLSFFSLVLGSLPLQGQATRSTSASQLALNKARQLFDEGQYQTATLYVEDYLSSHPAKAYFTKNEAEELAYISLAGGIIQHEATAVGLATAMVNKAENRSTSVKLAYHLGHYYFSLAMYPETIRFLEMTDKLYLSKEQGQRVAFEKGVSISRRKNLITPNLISNNCLKSNLLLIQQMFSITWALWLFQKDSTKMPWNGFRPLKKIPGIHWLCLFTWPIFIMKTVKMPRRSAMGKIT